jgi:hypothetical protein
MEAGRGDTSINFITLSLNTSRPFCMCQALTGLLTGHAEMFNIQGTREQVAARCETVLNTTMAEFDTYHVQKVEDFERIAAEHLDEEIELHEQVKFSGHLRKGNLLD